MTNLCKEITDMGKGIGNENRYRILEILMKGPKTVGDITQEVNLAQPAVSQHLKVLKSARLVTDERQGQEVIYSINVAYMASLLKKMAMNLSKKYNK